MIPGDNLRYSKDHEWVETDGDTAIIGITNYAQVQLGDIVFVELPELGMEADKDEAICAVESVKTAADVLTPVSGEVVEVNEGKTSCQKVGTTYDVDETLSEHLCPKAHEAVQTAAARMRSTATEGSATAPARVDVSCPDGYVVYRLSMTTDNREGGQK